ncbi:hypothetical protein Pcac1_g8554 [Phytophthora cactorum]|nr:hypothetical protein Pcac1_g8554 [Phytophthora cactorum]
MPSQLRLKRHTPEERRRVLDAYSSGGDWRAIAHYNGFPRTTAEYLVGHGRVEDLPRGGSRANKVTPEIKEALETWMNECCTFTLRTLQNLVVEDFNVKLSQTTISRHLIDMISLKAHIKDYLALMRNEMNNPVLTMNGEPISKTEARMQLLERAAHVCMTKITQRMVQKMELHASKFVSAAVRMEDMVMLRFGYDGCRVMETYMENAVFLRQALVDTDFFNIVDKAHMPLVAFSLKDSSAYTCFDKLKGRDDHARGGQAELLVPNG